MSRTTAHLTDTKRELIPFPEVAHKTFIWLRNISRILIICSVAFLAPPRGFLPALRARTWPRVLYPHRVQLGSAHITYSVNSCSASNYLIVLVEDEISDRETRLDLRAFQILFCQWTSTPAPHQIISWGDRCCYEELKLNHRIFSSDLGPPLLCLL